MRVAQLALNDDYAQLDGIGDDIALADCWLIYVFVCFDDFEVKAILQSA